MSYSRTTWVNGTTPAINAGNLNNIEAGIVDLNSRLSGQLFDVTDSAYGAVGDGVTDDTVAIQAAIADAVVDRGTVFFPHGTFIVSSPLIIRSSVDFKGSGVGASQIKLKANSNCDVFKSLDFVTYTGGSTQNGPSHWSISCLTVDGNGSQQTAESYCLRVYASCYQVRNVEFKNGYSGEVWSEWGISGSDMEALWSDVKILGGGTVNSHGPGLNWQGPHDSMFSNVVVNSADGYNGIYVHGNAGGEQFINTHVWGVHDVNWKIEQPIRVYGGVAEGATGQCVLWLCNKGTFHGEVFGTNGTNPTEIGFQIGDATHTNRAGSNIDITTWNWGAGSTPLVFSSDGGNIVRAVGAIGGATAFRTGTISSKTFATIVCNDDSSKSLMFAPSGLQVFNPLTFAIRAEGNDGTALRVNTNTSPHAIQLAAGSQLQGYIGSFATETFRLDAATGGIQPGTTSGKGASVFSGTGAPSLSGTAGDMYIRKDGGAGTWLYRCTGTTNWTAML